MESHEHNTWMQLALEQADLAGHNGDVPVGCVIVGPSGQLLGTGFNRRQVSQDPTAHAEIVALQAASQALGHWRLCDCTLYVTLEPCPMCAGAIVNARIATVVYGCHDPKAGAVESLFRLVNDPRLNHRAEIVSGVMAEQCASRLTSFFAALRALGKK